MTSVLDALTERAVNAAFDVAMRINRRRHWPSFVAAATDPGAVQRRTLARILTENTDTTFGRVNGFRDIDGPDSFRKAVAVNDYEALRPLIEEQERSGIATLTAAPPVLYAQTSGTSGSPKYLPITADGVSRVARIQRLFAGSVHAGTDMFAGKIVGIGSPAVEGHLPGGTPFGSASGMVYEGMPAVVRRKYVLEPEVLAIADHAVRYEVMAALCLAERDVTGVATANPSTLLRLRSVMVDRWDD
ncbi:MAG: GH3 auxin-responsive promoter family protein, partial [Actinomycetota bacterium]